MFDWIMPLIGPSVLAGLGEMGNFQHAPTPHSCAPCKYVCGGNNAQAMSPVSHPCDELTFALARLRWFVAPPGQPCACATVRHVALVFRKFFGQI